EWSGRAALLAFLLFLYFPLSDLVASPPGTAHYALVVAGVAAFVAVYLSLMLASATPLATPGEWLRLAALFALALAISLDNTAQWAPFFIYIAAVCGFRLPQDRAVPGILACIGLAGVVSALGGYPGRDTICCVVYAL